MSSYNPDDELPTIPQERVFIDAIILDEELQRETELIERELAAAMRLHESREGLPAIPKARTIIDAVSLDEEIQLERELIEEEYRAIRAAWDAYVPRATWPQPLPMLIPELEDDWNLSILQVQFLQHLVFIGEIGDLEVAGLCNHLAFKTAYELFREKWGGYALQTVREAANLMWELRAVI